MKYNYISYIKGSNKILFEIIETENDKFTNNKSYRNFNEIKGKNRSYKLTKTNIYDEIYLAYCLEKPEIKYSYKIIEKKKISNEDDSKKYIMEMCILLQIDHPNVVKTLEIISDSRNFYIIMEYNFEDKLLDIIVKQKHLTKEESAYYFYQIISGLEYLHSKKICHQNLNSQNIIINCEHRLKIVDFSLSNYFTKENNFLFKTHCSSLCYASPELILERKYDGFKNDLWSAGIILYEMLCGFHPFDVYEKDKQLLKKIVNCEFNYPEQYINENAKDLLKKILAKNQNDRINIEQIKNHPFFIIGKNIYLKHNNDNPVKFNPKDKNVKAHFKNRTNLNLNTLSNNINANNEIKNINTEKSKKTKKIELNLSNSKSNESSINKHKEINNDYSKSKYLNYQKTANNEDNKINNDEKILNNNIINSLPKNNYISDENNNNFIQIRNNNGDKNKNVKNYRHIENLKLIYRNKETKKNIVYQNQQSFKELFRNKPINNDKTPKKYKNIYDDKCSAQDNEISTNYKSNSKYIKNNNNFIMDKLPSQKLFN